MSKIQYVTLIIQLLAFFLSLIFYYKRRSKFILLVCLFLGLSALTELIGAYYLLKQKTGAEIIFYMYTFFEFNLIATIYYSLLSNKDKKIHRLIFILASVFNLLWFITVFFKTTLFSYLIIIGSISNGIYIIFYLRKILLSNEVLMYKKSLAFWVSVGFLVFYLPSIPFFTLYKYMQDRGLFFILHLLIILMNLFIIYGLLCSKKEKY